MYPRLTARYVVNSSGSGSRLRCFITGLKGGSTRQAEPSNTINTDAYSLSFSYYILSSKRGLPTLFEGV